MKHPVSIFALGGILLAGTAGAAFAQNTATPPPEPQSNPMNGSMTGPMHGRGGHHAPDPDRELAHLTKKLNLTADQQAQIKPILVDRVQQMETLRADTTTARADKFAKMKSINEDGQNKLTAVLTDEQKQQYQKMRDEQRERMHQHMHDGGNGGNPPPPPPA